MFMRWLRGSQWRTGALVLSLAAMLGWLALPSAGSDGVVLANGGCHCH